MDYDSFFTGAHDKPEWLLTNNRDANPFRSLTPYGMTSPLLASMLCVSFAFDLACSVGHIGQVNPHNPLATLIPPKDAVTVDNNPNFRFMGEYNPNREPVRPHDLETHAILAFLELKSEEMSRKPTDAAFPEPVSFMETEAKCTCSAWKLTNLSTLCLL